MKPYNALQALLSLTIPFNGFIYEALGWPYLMKPYNALQALLSLISPYKDFINEALIRGL